MNRILLLGVTSLCGFLPCQVQWTQHPALSARSAHGMAYDSVRQRVLAFGGALERNDLWEWDGAAWTPRTVDLAPPGRMHHAMAFDPVRGRLVVFGGVRYVGVGEVDLDDTWVWDGTRWTDANPAQRPTARRGAAMAFDPARGRVVLFGGSDQATRFDDMWEWDGSNWTQLLPAFRPPARAYHAMAEDPSRSRIVLYGGSDGVQLFTDTWVWDGTAWLAATPIVAPPLFPGAAACHDPTSGRTLLLGLLDARPPQISRMETWAFDGSNWTLLASGSPSLRQFVAIASDPVRRRAVVYGGGSLLGVQHGDTWEFDGATWTMAQAVQTPVFSFQSRPALAYDERRGVMVLVGNGPTSLETWEHSGSAWIERRGVAPPFFFITFGHAVAYDIARGQVVLFGGASPYGDHQTWVYDGVRWSQRGVSPRPPGQSGGHALAYDQRRSRVVLFGGRWGSPSVTWEWDGSQWTEMRPAHAPMGRDFPAMTWHPGRQRVLLYGGGQGATGAPMADLWEWDGTDWSLLAASVPPGTRSRHQMVFDTWRDRLVVHGGWSGSVTYLDDTWEWDGVNWMQRSPTRTPGALPNFAMQFDPATGASLLYGGLSPATWSYGPVVAAEGRTFGTGCQGSAGVPSLAAESGSRPWLGGDYRQLVTRVPPGGLAFAELGLSDRSWYGLPLPFDLTPLGMTGCWQRVSTDLVTPLATGTGSVTFVVAIPDNPSLAGLTFYCQVLALDAAANPFGATLSNATASRIGGR